MEKDDKGSTMIRMGVSGWMFLLIPAYPGCPGSKAIKRSLLLLLYWVCLSVFSCTVSFVSISQVIGCELTASEMTYTVSSGALNSTPSSLYVYEPIRFYTTKIDRQLFLWRDVDFVSPRRLNEESPRSSAFYRNPPPGGAEGGSRVFPIPQGRRV